MSDAPLNLFIPITKIDQAKRLVYGIATGEEVDSANEICDYASTKPLYEKWSNSAAETTGGKSLGNLRAMHGPTAAGKLTAISFNDAAKQIEICAKVVDDAEWRKVEEGVYTGFSQGGSYVKRWKDEATGLQRYTAAPSEVSLVDLPCLPTATFSLIKADGVVELRKFRNQEVKMPTNNEIAALAAELAKAAGSDKWGDFVEPAKAQLLAKDGAETGLDKAACVKDDMEMAAKADDESAEDEPDDEAAEGEEEPKKDSKKDDKSEKAAKPETPTETVHGRQVWKSNRDGALFAKKAEMIAHNEAFDAAQRVKGATATAEEKVAELAAEIAKRRAAPEAEKPAVDETAVAELLAIPDEQFEVVSKFLQADLKEAAIAKRAEAKEAAEREAALAKAKADQDELVLLRAEVERLNGVLKAKEDEVAAKPSEELRIAREENAALGKRFDDLSAQIADLIVGVKEISETPLPLPMQQAAGPVSKDGSFEDALEKVRVAERIAHDPEFAISHFIRKAQDKPLSLLAERGIQ